VQIEINDIELKERGFSERGAKAAAFCEMDRLAFQQKLAEKKIAFQFGDTFWDEELGSIDKITMNDDGGE
jgi:hypothetical protein